MTSGRTHRGNMAATKCSISVGWSLAKRKNCRRRSTNRAPCSDVLWCLMPNPERKGQSVLTIIRHHNVTTHTMGFVSLSSSIRMAGEKTDFLLPRLNRGMKSCAATRRKNQCCDWVVDSGQDVTIARTMGDVWGCGRGGDDVASS